MRHQLLPPGLLLDPGAAFTASIRGIISRLEFRMSQRLYSDARSGGLPKPKEHLHALLQVGVLEQGQRNIRLNHINVKDNLLICVLAYDAYNNVYVRIYIYIYTYTQYIYIDIYIYI